tara:strand:+ start:13736 stop:13966 length:231 start_codon:yes stop_codon:yes gene_type:complete
MSNYKGYNELDNIRRKKNNLPDNHFESSTNTNTKRWTTSGSAQSEYLRKKLAAEHKSPVKVFTQEEINELNKKRSA